MITDVLNWIDQNYERVDRVITTDLDEDRFPVTTTTKEQDHEHQPNQDS